MMRMIQNGEALRRLAVAALCAPVMGCMAAASDPEQAFGSEAMPMGVMEEGELAPGEGVALLLASLDVAEGHRVDFFDHGDGTIGMLEVLPDHERPLVTSLVEEEGATALEVFLALRPFDEPPAALREAHVIEAGEQGRTSTEPHDLLVARPLAFADPGGPVDYSFCRSLSASIPFDDGAFSDNWRWNREWSNGFASLTTEDSAVFEDEVIAGWQYFYAGGSVVRRAYLGVCVGDLSATYSDGTYFQIQRATAAGPWVTMLRSPIVLHQDEKAIYFASSLSTAYRYRGMVHYKTWGVGDNAIRHIGLGVAHDPPFVIGGISP